MLIKRDEFSAWIEKTRAETEQSYMDTILHGCDEFKVDIELVTPLLSEQIIAKVKAEAISKHFIKTDSNSLKGFL